MCSSLNNSKVPFLYSGIDLRNGKVTQIVGSTLTSIQITNVTSAATSASTPSSCTAPETAPTVSSLKRNADEGALAEAITVKRLALGDEKFGEIKESDAAKENFVTDQPSSYFAELYCKHKLTGGHIIMLGRQRV